MKSILNLFYKNLSVSTLLLFCYFSSLQIFYKSTNIKQALSIKTNADIWKFDLMISISISSEFSIHIVFALNFMHPHPNKLLLLINLCSVLILQLIIICF